MIKIYGSSFDQQDSGNISFGVEKNDEKLFIKYAGAKTLTFSGELQILATAFEANQSHVPLVIKNNIV